MIKLESLLDICNITTGKLDSNAAMKNGEYPFFTCSPITLNIDSFAFDIEAVLLAGNNAAGKFSIKYYNGKFNAYQRTYVINAKSNISLLNRYLYFALSLQLTKLQNLSTGAATKFLTLGILKQIYIPIPNLKIQEKITSILSNYDDLIENNLKRIALLEESARLLYQEWFVKFRFPDCKIGDKGFPDGWTMCSLSDLVTLHYGKSLKESAREDGDIPVFGSSGIVGRHNKFLVKGPSIIVGRKGNVGSVYYTAEDCFAIDTVYFIKSEEVTFYNFFLLQSQDFVSSDTAVPGLNRNYAYSLKVLKPAQTLLKKFEDTVAPMFEQIQILSISIDQLQKARDELLPKLVSGKIKV